jgi:hypothetical protein
LRLVDAVVIGVYSERQIIVSLIACLRAIPRIFEPEYGVAVGSITIVWLVSMAADGCDLKVRWAHQNSSLKLCGFTHPFTNLRNFFPSIKYYAVKYLEHVSHQINRHSCYFTWST